MKTWELIEQLQDRDPSGEVVLTLSGDGAMVDDLQSALQRVIDAQLENMRDDTSETLAAVLQAHADAKEISTRSYP